MKRVDIEVQKYYTAYQETGLSRGDAGKAIHEAITRDGKKIDINSVYKLLDRNLRTFDATRQIIDLRKESQ